MKRLTIIAALLLMTMPMIAERVTPETARKVATTFLNNNGAKIAQLTDLSKSAGFPNLYIFTSEQGFVIMSADDCVKPILGYSLTDKFTVGDMPESLRWWLQGYDDEIQYTIDNHIEKSPDISKEWQELSNGKNDIGEVTVIVSPLIQSNWKQDAPFNNLCPTNCVTGCVATAMAQVMRYHSFPEHGIGSHDYILNSTSGTLSADFGTTYYDWSNMKLNYSQGYNNDEALAVATLMYHCGISVEMKYGPSSGSTIQRSSNSLSTYFNYNTTCFEKEDFDDNDSTWISMLKKDIDNGKPVLYGGQGSSGGHAFVCDGYDSRNYFHFNWGWGSIGETYYSINGHSFPNGQCAVFNITPSLCSASAPTNLTCTQQNGYNITLSWEPADESVSYNIYRNNNLIANTCEPTYTDSLATLGDNIYYIRSVDATDNLSLSSNCINVQVTYQEPIVKDLTFNYSDNDVSLSWTTPWWYPQTTSDIVSYVDGYRPYEDQFVGWLPGNYCLYWGVRYLAENLTDHQGKALYKVSLYTREPASYQVLIYQGTDTENNRPMHLKATQSIVSARTGWIEIMLDQPVFIDSDEDLWVFIYNPDGKIRITPCKDVNYQGYGRYYSADNGSTHILPHNNCTSLSYKIEWLIRSYITEDYYSYSVLDNDNNLNEEAAITDLTYSVENPENNTIHKYTVKTNYFAGESASSNTASLALGSNTLASLTLENNDNMTIGNGSTLIVNGMLTNNNPENLVLENGAQLFNNSEGVKATVKNSITAYTCNTDGWNFIASPVTESLTPDEVNGLLYGSYDLYRLNENPLIDESTTIGKEWENYKSHSEDFSIVNGQGYLYANSTDNTLEFVGTLNANDGDVSLNYHPDAQFAGWNLVGNPFPCNTIITKSNESISYYVIDDQNNRKLKSVTAGTVIAPNTSVIVKAEGQGESVTFNKATQQSSVNQSYLQMTVAQNVLSRGTSKTIEEDNAIVSFNEGCQLEKFYFGDNNANIYIPKDSREYAIQCAEIQCEMPINFRATEDGSYTLTINPEGVEMNYLHLIDNITGADFDLLTNPNYTFEAKTTDYESRFKLVFASGSIFGDSVSTGSASFAFFNNGQWIINNNGESTIQVLDVTGRILRNERVSGGCGIKINYAPGVYFLRLINGEKVKTQKIVIE